MPTKVLVFESDPAFAGELRTELGRLGLAVQVVDDGNAGLSAAQSEKPGLILLSIELPRMNGFSVCNKLKKDAALKDVPLIIMSTESSDETFDQHRKLRTRAEDYVHKPIAFGELLDHIRPLVPGIDGGAAAATEDGAIVIDEEVETEGGAGAAPDAKIDAEVEAFAENAFGHLLDEQPAAKAPAPSRPPVTSARASVPPTAGSVVRQRPSFRPGPDDVGALRAELETQRAEVMKLEREAGSLKAQLTQTDENAQRVQRELDELRVKASSGAKVGGVSGREFLDLREALNKKDKEILGLRDQVSKKEKDLLDASESGIALERTKADLEDQVAGLNASVAASKAAADTANAEKDQIARRAAEARALADKLKSDLDARNAELVALRAEYERAMAAEVAQGKERLEQAVAATRDAERRTGEENLARAREEAEQAKAFAVREREEQLGRERDEERGRLSAEIANAKREADEARAFLGQREREFGEERGRMEARIAEVSGDLSARTEQRDAALHELAQGRERLGGLEADLGVVKGELAQARDSIAEQAHKLEQATAKWQENHTSLENAKDALAAALAHIEEAGSRTIG